MFASLYQPSHDNGARGLQPSDVLAAIAADFSPRFELHRSGRRVAARQTEREALAERQDAGVPDIVVIDISGLERLLGTTRRIGEELRRTASTRGVHVQAALAGTQTAAMILARAQSGLTITGRGTEADRLAPLPLDLLDTIAPLSTFGLPSEPNLSIVEIVKRWGLRTLGDLAALPPADLVARLGRPALVWQALARGEDVRPLIPALEEERFEGTLELEWPIDGLEPLSFVLTRLLEPLSTRLERRDRGAAVLHVRLGLITRSADGAGPRDVHARRIELPTPMRDVRSLRTLALLDLESHPPTAAIDRVTIVIDPTPGRVLQHRLFTRAHPTPEQISTLVARLNALMGQDRVGTPATVDTYRPGAFAMQSFAAEHRQQRAVDAREEAPRQNVASSLRRCRQPVPARVAVAADRPVRVTTDRRGFSGGAVVKCAGPWRSSGNWWTAPPTHATHEAHATDATHPTHATHAAHPTHATHAAHATHLSSWDHDEWDVSLSDGATYRLFRDRARDAWFIEAIVD